MTVKGNIITNFKTGIMGVDANPRDRRINTGG